MNGLTSRRERGNTLRAAERKQQLQLGTAKPLVLMDMDSVKWDSHHTGLSFNFTGTRSVVVSDQTLPTLDAVSTTDNTMQNQQQTVYARRSAVLQSQDEKPSARMRTYLAALKKATPSNQFKCI
ncbi:hypothetical protein Y1Q_0005773 [Alligator mississippiensis]|uniref:Uncharacterized protein n=1 Tax=Alligator mississippiensis TaxID=8496 RepID=A0A151MFV1_ALLMI|nr:hypothetical protein Y1Q_0005773 [Alligator mississippiensis]